MSKLDAYHEASAFGGRVVDDSPEGVAERAAEHKKLERYLDQCAKLKETADAAQSRKELREMFKAVKAARKKGETRVTVINRGVAYGFGQPGAPVSGGEVNEWDIDLGTNTTSLRQ